MPLPDRQTLVPWCMLAGVTNAVLWPLLASWSGWTFGGLGAALLETATLPINGVLTAFFAAPLLHACTPKRFRRSDAIGQGWLIVSVVLVLNYVYLAEVMHNRPTP